MPKTITTTVYTYDELPTEEAKEKARDWWREVSATDVYDESCQTVKEDAENIGLKIAFLSEREPNEGEFIDGAFNCMNKIFSTHGENCDTYKEAKEYEAAIDAIPEQQTNLEEESRNAESADVAEAEFLHALLECYRVMRDKEDEYQLSDEVVADNIRANEYTFAETGKRFG